MIIGIVAVSKNYAIGKDGKLPWHYSADLKFFKDTTTGNAVVMGANTWRSIGKHGIRTPNLELLMKLSNVAEVIELSKLLVKDVFIIGGARTYLEFAEVIEKWIVTEIPLSIESADTFMPNNFLDGFELEETKDLGDDLLVKILRRK